MVQTIQVGCCGSKCGRWRSTTPKSGLYSESWRMVDDTLRDHQVRVERDVFHPDDEAQAVAVLSALTNGVSVQLSLGDET